MTVVIRLEFEPVLGSTTEDAKARWTNNKVTAQVADLVEKAALGTVTKIDVYEER